MTKTLALALSVLVLSADVYAVPRDHGRLDSTTNNTAVSSGSDGSFGNAHSASRCARHYKINGGDTCDKISAAQKTSTYQLSILNPKINSGCTNLVIGDLLCLGLQDKDCTKIHVVESGDICAKITKKAGITLSDLYTNNPNINQDCTNIYTGEVLCVASATHTGKSSGAISTSDSDLPQPSLGDPSSQGSDMSSDTPLAMVPSADAPTGGPSLGTPSGSFPSTSDNSPSQGDSSSLSFPAALMNLTSAPVDMNTTINGIPPIKSDSTSTGSSPFNMTAGPVGFNITAAAAGMALVGGPGSNATVAGPSTSSFTAPNPSPN